MDEQKQWKQFAPGDMAMLESLFATGSGAGRQTFTTADIGENQVTRLPREVRRRVLDGGGGAAAGAAARGGHGAAAPQPAAAAGALPYP
eukprot:gene31997-20313_t